MANERMRLTLRQERRQKPTVCAVRFEDEARAVPRQTRHASTGVHGIGVALEVWDGRRWVRGVIVDKDAWAIVVRPVAVLWIDALVDEHMKRWGP